MVIVLAWVCRRMFSHRFGRNACRVLVRYGRYQIRHNGRCVPRSDIPEVKGQCWVTVAWLEVSGRKKVTSPQVWDSLRRIGYRPATIDELLAASLKRPRRLRQRTLVALGTVFKLHDTRVACLDGNQGLRLARPTRLWPAQTTVFAVVKVEK